MVLTMVRKCVEKVGESCVLIVIRDVIGRVVCDQRIESFELQFQEFSYDFLSKEDINEIFFFKEENDMIFFVVWKEFFGVRFGYWQ